MTGVTQGDREAAATYLERTRNMPCHYSDMREGSEDDHRLVQAFAAHRLAAIEEQREEEAEALAVQYAQARATAIEECAKVAEQTTSCAITNYVHGKAIATAIRNLKGAGA